MNSDEQSMFSSSDVYRREKNDERPSRVRVVLFVMLLLLLGSAVAVAPRLIDSFADSGNARDSSVGLAGSSLEDDDEIDDVDGARVVDADDSEATSEGENVAAPNTAAAQPKPEVTAPVPKPESGSVSKPTPDTTPPKITPEYSATEPTGDDVTVVVRGDEEIVCPTGWTQVDAKTCRKTYVENADEKVVFEDKSGNKTTVDIRVPNIDKVPIIAALSDSPTPLYAQDTGALLQWTVILQVNRKVAVSDNWLCAEKAPYYECSKSFSKNGDYIVVLQDVAKKIKRYKLSVQSIGLGNDHAVAPVLSEE
jgi:hypothetical protein